LEFVGHGGRLADPVPLQSARLEKQKQFVALLWLVTKEELNILTARTESKQDLKII
jgi:hypothetical protein